MLLHSTEEIKIIKETKKIIYQLSQNGILSYQNIPLWTQIFPCDYDNTQLKNFSKQIQSIQVLHYEFSNNGIYLPVKIILEKTEITSKLQIINLLNSISETDVKKIIAASDLFPMQLKTFRIANAVSISTNTRAISNFVWKKIIS